MYEENESYDGKITLLAKKVLLIAVIVTSLFFGMVYFFIEYVATDFQYKKITIGKECIYLKYRAYTNDASNIFISTSKSRRINSATDYVYDRSFCIFYKIQNDTIFIFNSDVVNSPSRFKSKIPIIQKKISSPEFTDLYYQNNYKTCGYEEFPSR